MDFELGTVANLLLHKIGALTGAGGLFTLGVGIWVWLRAGSADAILDRLRRMVAGKHEISHKALKTHMTERKDREYFRYICRISVQTASQLDRLLVWIKKYDIGDDELRRCRLHIEPGAAEILKPTPLWLNGMVFAILLASLAGTLSGAVFALTPPFIRNTATGDWFIASEDGARSVFNSNRVYLPKAACTAPAPGSNKLDPLDETPLCDLISNPANAERLHGFEREQEWFGGILFILAGLSVFGTKTMLQSAIAASRISKRMRTVDAEEANAKTVSALADQPDAPSIVPVGKRKAAKLPEPGQEPVE